MKIYICGFGTIHLNGKCKCHKAKSRPYQPNVLSIETPHQPYALSADLRSAPPGYHLVEVRTEQDGTQKLHKL